MGKAKPKAEKNPDRALFDIRDLEHATGMCYRSLHRAVRSGRIATVRCGGAVKIPRAEFERVCLKGF